MVRCQNFLDRLNKPITTSTKSEMNELRKLVGGQPCFMVMQVHDELVFDFPVGDNKKHLRKIKQLMEQGDDDIGVPTPVSCEAHAENWSQGESLDA